MKRLTVVLILHLSFAALFSQINRFGTPVTRSYSLKEIRSSELNYCITRDRSGIIYIGNNDNVVLRYDGTSWTRIPVRQNTTTAIYAIGSDEKGIIYVGGLDEFGYIEPDSTGMPHYVSLNDRLTGAKDLTSATVTDLKEKTPGASDFAIGNIYSLIIRDNKIYYLSERTLIIYDTAADSLSYVNLRSLGLRQCMRIFLINNRIFFTDNVYGLFEYTDGRISQLPGGDFFGYKMNFTVLPYSDDQVIVGTFSSGLYLYNYITGSVDSSFFERKIFEKLKKLNVYCGTRLNSGEIVFGTVADGLFVFDENGKYSGSWNTGNTDMQDNTIYSLWSDPAVNSELWIVTDGFISKAYVNFPYYQFSAKAGLEGGINNFCEFGGSVYISTDNGLYVSSIADDDSRIFEQFSDITDQAFPLAVASVGKEQFLLAGTLFHTYKISGNGKMSLVEGNNINSGSKADQLAFDARSIIQSSVKPERFYFGLKSLGIKILDYENGKWRHIANVKGINGQVPFLKELSNGDILALTNYPDGLYRIPFNDTIPVQYGSDKGLPEVTFNSLTEINNQVIVCTTLGIYRLDVKEDRWIPYDELTGGYAKDVYVERVFSDTSGNIWVSTSEDRFYDLLFLTGNDTLVRLKGGPLNLISDVKLQNIGTIEGRTWLAKSKNLNIFDNNKLAKSIPGAATLLTEIVIRSRVTDSVIMNGTFHSVDENGRRYPVVNIRTKKQPEFKYSYNSISFHWTTPFMIEEDQLMYSYLLEGYEKEWSGWQKIGYKDFTNLPFGHYSFRVKAKTITDEESEEAVYNFTILKPWYLNPLMLLLYALAAILLVIGIIVAYTKRLKNENIRLEGIVAERTAVVVKQKEELESSIHYASRIQMALLPSEKILSENLKNYFILFKPRDIVSGDFYWMTKKGERLYIVASDCTGHGVPGAFMSLLGMSFLDEIIDKEKSPRADFILNQLRLHVIESLKQVGDDNEAKDGMDMAILVIDFKKERIEFSGAYNPCFRVRKITAAESESFKPDKSELPEGKMSDGKYLLETIYASKMPIGISSKMNEGFDFFDWKLEKGTSYYLFSDGYIDQFGGPHGRKFLKRNFKRLLLEVQDYPMNKQKEILEKTLIEWMGSAPQIDDILVMGIRTE